MNKQRLQLQSYLDSQLQQIDHIQPSEEKPTFDRLQQKLNLIENKLIRLKDQSVKANRYHQHQGNIQKSIIKKQSREFNSNRSGNKVLQTVLLQKTPEKPLKIISKTMSQGYFHFNPLSNQKTNQKKYDSQAKAGKNKYQGSNQKTKKTIKTLKKIQQLPNYNKSSSKKSIHFERSNKKLNKTHESNLIHLQKDIQNCLKSNAQLKVKINHLQGYKTQYCRLKEVFLQSQKMRKKVRS